MASASIINQYCQITNQVINENLYYKDNKRYYELSVGNLKVEVIGDLLQPKKNLKQLAFNEFVKLYSSQIENMKINHLKAKIGMESASMINHYSQITNQIIKENCYYKDNNRYYELSVGNLKVEVISDLVQSKKNLRQLACDEFIKLYSSHIENTKINHLKNKTENKIDYLEYSRKTILNNVNTYLNEKLPLEKPKLISIDSEGQPIKLAQIAINENTVYLYTEIDYVKTLLADPDIKKILCDISAEERSFGCNIVNYHDIQGLERKSLTRCIYEKYGIDLLKSKKIHFNNWDIISEKHIEYAISDAIWTWKIYNE